VADFYSAFTSKWNFDDATGSPQDSIGTRHGGTVGGVPDRSTGYSWIFDGVDDDVQWTAVNSPLPSAGPWTHTILWRPKASTNGVLWLVGEGEPSGKPYKRCVYLYDVPPDQLRTLLNSGSGYLATGREIEDGEWVASVVSYTGGPSNSYNVVHRTAHASQIDLSSTVAGASEPGSQKYFLARSQTGSSHYPYEVAEIGLVDGTTYSIADMQDQADAMLATIGWGVGGSTGTILGPVVGKVGGQIGGGILS